MFYDQEKFIAYHHIQKTGGTSFKSFLNENFKMRSVYDEPYLPLDTYYNALDSVQSYRIMTTVREPLAHIVSLWQYWRRYKKNKPDYILKVHDMSFKQFAEYYCNYEQLIDADNYFMWSYDKLLIVDFNLPGNLNVLKLESIADDAHFHLNEQWQLGVEVEIPFLNKTKPLREDYHPFISYHDEKTVALVHRKYAWVYDEMQWYPKPELTYAAEWDKLIHVMKSKISLPI